MIQTDLFKKFGLTWVAAELILGQRFGYVCLDRSLLEFLVQFLPRGLAGLPLLWLLQAVDRGWLVWAPAAVRTGGDEEG